MSGFLLRWALYILLVPLVIAASVTVALLGIAAILKYHDNGWFWLAALLISSAILAVKPEAKP